jgi:hypothetical protein
MAQDVQGPLDPASAVARRWWPWSVVVVVVLLAIAAGLGWLAWQLYDSAAPRTFKSVIGSNLLHVAVIAIGGLVIGALLGGIQEMRAKRERDRARRLELLRRMRAAHVRIARAQRLLRADDSPGTYGKQMRALMAVARDLEEVREEVRVSGRLYKKPDRRSIMWGIALILIFLERLSTEYTDWSNLASGLKGKSRDNRWVADLVAVRKSRGPALDPSDEDWAPTDVMPDDYECGITKSKGTMREYAYGTRKRLAAWRRLARWLRKGGNVSVTASLDGDVTLPTLNATQITLGDFSAVLTNSGGATKTLPLAPSAPDPATFGASFKYLAPGSYTIELQAPTCMGFTSSPPSPVPITVSSGPEIPQAFKITSGLLTWSENRREVLRIRRAQTEPRRPRFPRSRT